MPPADGSHFLAPIQPQLSPEHIERVAAAFLADTNRAKTKEPVYLDSDVVFKKTMIEQNKLRRQKIIEQSDLTEVDLKNCAHVFSLHTRLDDLSKELEKEKDSEKISEIENLYEQVQWEFQSTPSHDELFKIYELDYYIAMFEQQLIKLEQHARVRHALRGGQVN